MLPGAHTRSSIATFTHTHAVTHTHTHTHTRSSEMHLPTSCRAKASAIQVPVINVMVNGEQDVNLLTHFRKADTDSNGMLDGNELVATVRELAQASKTPLTQREVRTE